MSEKVEDAEVGRRQLTLSEGKAHIVYIDGHTTPCFNVSLSAVLLRRMMSLITADQLQ